MNKQSPQIARRYAQAIFSMAQDKGVLGEIREDFEGILSLIEASDEFKNFLKDPVMPKQIREKILKKIFYSKVAELTFSFLMFLNKKDRLGEFKNIAECFGRLYLVSVGVLKARLTSAVALQDAQIKMIASQLKKYFKKEIHMSSDVDPGLLGGFKVRIDDWIYDSSIRRQMERFRVAVLRDDRRKVLR